MPYSKKKKNPSNKSTKRKERDIGDPTEWSIGFGGASSRGIKSTVSMERAEGIS
jgi:hypothetical protein